MYFCFFCACYTGLNAAKIDTTKRAEHHNNKASTTVKGAQSQPASKKKGGRAFQRHLAAYVHVYWLLTIYKQIKGFKDRH